MRQTLLALFALIAPAAALAQTITPTWKITTPQANTGWVDKDGESNHVTPLPGGGYLAICGKALGSQGNVFIARLTAQGSTLWTKATAVRLGQTLTGESNYTHDTQGNTIIADARGVIKLNANGDTTWTRKFSAAFSSLATNPVIGGDGNYVVAFQQENTSTTPEALQVLKFDAATGQTLWTTSLNAQLAATYPSGYSWYGCRPTLARRASGYFVFVTGNTGSNVMLLNETGAYTGIHSLPVNYSIATAVFSRSNTTLWSTGAAIYRLNDQGITTARSTVGSSVFAEDDQQNIILLRQSSYISGGPGSNATYYTFSVQRLDSALHSIGNIQPINLGYDITSSFMYSLTCTPNEYLIAGGSSLTSSSYLTVASLPSLTALANKEKVGIGALALYPTRTASGARITASVPVGTTGQIGIYDVMGRQQGPRQPVSSASTTVAVPSLAAGIYVVRFTDKQGRTQTNRLQVE
ncbi:T9SS type A sorting domain-containing protein [Hymenobacter sp. 15J16-1T3B]|uniref:T9SS type A sorting domain-containing protein n=1 Tax=Hymenobacter sp. 15J16-1T3B TaxID=2886941 RepID=UPI001D110E4E|nr:T9SS type A sorting domain-containing protein [Hymenobacter sp. 15J16-1T3B]